MIQLYAFLKSKPKIVQNGFKAVGIVVANKCDEGVPCADHIPCTDLT